MSLIHDIIQALWEQDFSALADPQVIWVIYSILFITLFLENGLLPASFLPGDSLLLLTGAMIAKGVMNFIPTMLLLTIAASLGYWLSYLQGRWLGDTRIIKGWLLQLPIRYHQRAYHMFYRHGLVALLVGRFLVFIRTLLPTMAGISGLNNFHFQLVNWISSFLWVFGIVTFGYAISCVPLVKHYENQVMTAMIIFPVVLLIIGFIGMLVMLWYRRRSA
ncbi:MAG: DedA family protein [Candidatus Malihini olakiniferum]